MGAYISQETVNKKVNEDFEKCNRIQENEFIFHGSKFRLKLELCSNFQNKLKMNEALMEDYIIFFKIEW